MRQQRSENNKYQTGKRRAAPLLSGATALKVLCALLAAANLWLLYGIFSPSQGITSYRQHRRQLVELQEKIQILQTENQKLFKKIQKFKADPKVQERAVREQLGWTREGEWVIEFLPSDQDPS